MKDVLLYKGFIGSIHFSAEDSVFFGKVEGINDLVTFEGSSVEEIKKSFHEAVDDYIALCEKTGKEALKSFKGSFNVRISPELHRKALIKATTLGISLNQLIQRAIDKEISDSEAGRRSAD